MRFLLDSVILIDHFNRIPEATSFIRDNMAHSAISVITRAEVLTGFDPSDRKTASDFLDCFTLFDITASIADSAAALRYDNKWKLPDAFQAAISIRHGLGLVTRNTKDFPPNRHDFVVVPYAIA